jgi:hypothetical protein
MRTSALLQIGGYDESLPAMEDVDVYLRLACVGAIRTMKCVTAIYRTWGGNVDATRSATGTIAVVEKHLNNLPALPPEERRLAEYGLAMRAAVSEQTLLRGGPARMMLRRAARADARRSLSSQTWWRIMGASLVPHSLAKSRRGETSAD